MFFFKNINNLKNIFILIFIITFLKGCTNTDMKSFSDKTPNLDLFNFFNGESIAYGIFEDRFGKLRRQFRVNLIGSIKDNKLILDEKFLYDDGETDTRVWTITKDKFSKDQIKYSGTAKDIEGKAKGTSSGNALNWSYDIYLNIQGKNLKVRFNDWIYQQDEHVAINRAYVSKFGIEIGSVTLVFLRGNAAKTIGKLNLDKW